MKINIDQTNPNIFVLTGCGKIGRGHGDGHGGEKKGDKCGKKLLITLKEIHIFIRLGKSDMNVPVTLSIAKLVAAKGL
jgi:hypothetical protein